MTRTVLHLLRDLEIGGIQTSISELVDPLAQRGWATVVAAFGGGPVAERLAEHGVPVMFVEPPSSRLLRQPVRHARAVVQARRTLERVVSRWGVNVVQANMLKNYESMIPSGIPTVISLQNERLHPAAERPSFTSWAYGRLHRRVWSRAGAVVAVSAPVAAAARSLGMASVELIPNSVDTHRFIPRNRTPALRTTLGISDAAPLVVAVGRLAPQKAYPDLFAAWRIVAERVEPTPHLLVVGDGPDALMLDRQRETLGLDTVHLLGARDDVATLLAEADVFVLSSRYEGLPIALLEAMSCGCPVVATTVGGVVEVVRDGVEGRLIEPGEPALLAAALVELLDGGLDLDTLGAAARSRVESCFSLERTADRYAALYDRLAMR